MSGKSLSEEGINKKMLRNTKGFSFAELMISMVILSIVLTMVTGTMVYISKKNSATDEKNHGYQIAKEKLIELQYEGAVVNNSGSDTPSRNSVDYEREWEIDTEELPYPVTVRVYWTTNSKKDSAIVIGYVSADVCATPEDNKPPTAIYATNFDGDTIVSSPIVIEKNGDIFVCNLLPYDADEEEGDIVSLTWDETELHNSQFYLRSGNQLYSSTTTPGNYVVKVDAMDCAGETFSRTINITVDDGIALDLTPYPKTIDEFEPNGNSAGQMHANKPGGTWSITTIQSTFAINTSTGEVTVKDNSGLDHKSAPTVTLRIKYILGDQSLSEDFRITVANVNENPETISLSNKTVEAGSNYGTVVGKITGSGPDDNDHTDSLLYTMSNSASGAFDIAINSLIVANKNLITEGLKTIKIRATDSEGLFVEKTFVITVEPGASECDKYTPWNSSSQYNSGTIITNEGFVWKCTQWSPAGTKPNPSPQWQAQSICGGINHSSFSYYSSSKRYNAGADKHRIIKYGSNLYVCLKNEWGNLGQISNTYYWKNIGKF